MSNEHPNPPELWLLRHAATDWSENGRHTGCRTNLPLNAAGRAAAMPLRKALENVSFAAVLSSPLDRCVETCRLAGRGETMKTDPDLVEWDYGDFEGLTTPQIRERYPAWTIWSGPWPGGETADEVGARAKRVIERLRGIPGRVAIFSHGHFSRVLAATWLGFGAAEGKAFALDTGTYSVLGWEHEYPTLRKWNEMPGE